jgi:hypothetical protein
MPRGGLAVAPGGTAPSDLPRDVIGPTPARPLADLPALVFGPSAEPVPHVALAPSKMVSVAELPLDVFGGPGPSPETTTVISRSLPNSNGSQGAGPRLGHAVELTREALYAWMNVLTGPALVEVTSR